MYTAIPTVTVADGPLHPVRRTGILYCTDLKDSRQIRKDYSNAKRRLIIIGEDNASQHAKSLRGPRENDSSFEASGPRL
ncbi:hypothetical protein PCASD_15846 [Puccinia coronata f. sp. avenae]|uniref:Uncharacterized protein n=1 Tax=Puccinia coronata f. sp. avenae TaxID=200324 RepID=A0A2N5T5V1_9BASI|nr:hypothetical protein PCASD_15846 [Puccinia coronata f. sp. avenae]